MQVKVHSKIFFLKYLVLQNYQFGHSPLASPEPIYIELLKAISFNQHYIFKLKIIESFSC